jgi:FkbH-like protein
MLSFREQLAAALAHESDRDRLAALTGLAHESLGLVETIQLDRALAGVPAAARQALVPVRLALLSTNTVDHLLPALRVAGLARGLQIDATAGAFGQYRAELLAADSPLLAHPLDAIVLSLSARPLTSALLPGDADGERRAIEAALAELCELWRAARERFGAAVIQQTYLDVFEPLFGNHDRIVPGTAARLIARLNERVAEAAAEQGVLLLDVAHAAARDGLDAWFDTARWLQGKMEIAPGAARRYGDLLARLLTAWRGRSRKCLVLDLDNTLWGGVVGDVGIEGLVLGEGSARGEAHLALHRYALSLKQRGVVLAVCSKNDPAIADRAFREHPEMLLKRSDVAAFVANWDDKAANLRRIAEQLNLGLDSLVFVDDNPAERARVRASLPMVAVPELPEDPALYVRCIAERGDFDAIALTDEDRQRGAQYAANAERNALRGVAQSMDEFLEGLDMVVEVGPARPVDLARVAQLINKTNQFNTTGRRRAEDEIARLATDPANLVLRFRLADRFGDNGLVSAMVLLAVPGQPDTMDVDGWVMSCRVFGRQLEREAMNIAVELLRARGVRRLIAAYIPTERNRVIAHLYEQLGFTLAGADAAGMQRYELDFSGYRPQPTFIRRKIAP